MMNKRQFPPPHCAIFYLTGLQMQEEEDLIKNNEQVDRTEGDNNRSDGFKLTVDA